ncbi:MAG: hypothetical protein ACJ8R9_19565 [Steroidobacteraceae bacterium]
MKRSIVLMPATLCALFTLSVTTAWTADLPEVIVKARVPQTAAARASSALIERVEHAFSDYAATCASGGGRASSRKTTDDLRLEYPLAERGTYVSIDGKDSPANCAAISGVEGHVANLWIFPTNDAESVFVQYDVQTSSGAAPQRQLALIEMRGERIARFVSFADQPPALMATVCCGG